MDINENDITLGYADFVDDESSEQSTEENNFSEKSALLDFEEMSDINRKLRTYFDGKIVRKDLTKSIKEGANVPVYVLNFYLDSIAVLMTRPSLKKVWQM